MTKKNNYFIDSIKSAWSWILIAGTVLVCFGPVCLTTPCLYLVDRTRKGIHPIISFWAKLIITVCPVMNVHTQGERHLKPNQTYVLVFNHQSIADIIVALHLKHSFKFIAKKELFDIPIMGWSMTMAGYIPLVRGNKQSAKKALMTAKDYLKCGTTVLFFPEGTRSVDGEIKDFKLGAFKLAAEVGVPIVPVVIDGTFNLVPKGSRSLAQNVKVRLKVLEPQKPLGTDETSIERWAEEVRGAMVSELSALRSKQEMKLTSV